MEDTTGSGKLKKLINDFTMNMWELSLRDNSHIFIVKSFINFIRYPDGEKYIKTLPQLYSEYIQSVGRNGNYLLNINPNQLGLIDNADMQRYIEFGAVLGAFEMTYALGNTSGSGDEILLSFNQPVYIERILISIKQLLTTEILFSKNSWKWASECECI